ncbi:hypothetical protein EDD17DRAFT_1590718, partial [Pisolithus thermaeus]
MWGELPRLPASESTQFRMTDAWWRICTSCWAREPSSRPTMRDIVDRVKAALLNLTLKLPASHAQSRKREGATRHQGLSESLKWYCPWPNVGAHRP